MDYRRSTVDDVRSRRIWAVDDDRSRRIRRVVDEDRHPRRYAVDNDQNLRIAFYQAQAKASLDRIDKNLRSIRRMRMQSTTISEYSFSSSSTSRHHKQLHNQPVVIDDYYPPLELPLKWRNPPPDHLIRKQTDLAEHKQPASVIHDLPPIKPHPVDHDSSFISTCDEEFNTASSHGHSRHPIVVEHDLPLQRRDPHPQYPQYPPPPTMTNSHNFIPLTLVSPIPPKYYHCRNVTDLEPDIVPVSMARAKLQLHSDFDSTVDPKEYSQSDARQESGISSDENESNSDVQHSDMFVPEIETPDISVISTQVSIASPTILCGDVSSTATALVSINPVPQPTLLHRDPSAVFTHMVEAERFVGPPLSLTCTNQPQSQVQAPPTCLALLSPPDSSSSVILSSPRKDIWDRLSCYQSKDRLDIFREKGTVDSLFQTSKRDGSHVLVVNSYEYISKGLCEKPEEIKKNNRNNSVNMDLQKVKMNVHLFGSFMETIVNIYQISTMCSDEILFYSVSKILGVLMKLDIENSENSEDGSKDEDIFLIENGNGNIYIAGVKIFDIKFTNQVALRKCLQTVRQNVKEGFELDVFVGNCFGFIYLKWGDLANSWEIMLAKALGAHTHCDTFADMYRGCKIFDPGGLIMISIS